MKEITALEEQIEALKRRICKQEEFKKKVYWFGGLTLTVILIVQYLTTIYKNLFNIQNDIIEEAQNYEGTPTDVAHVWYDTTMILADGKFLNIEPALNRPLLEALNYLAWNKTQIERQAEEIRLAKAQMK